MKLTNNTKAGRTSRQRSQLKVAFCEKVEVCIDWKWVVVILNGASAALYGKLAVQLKEIW